MRIIEPNQRSQGNVPYNQVVRMMNQLKIDEVEHRFKRARPTGKLRSIRSHVDHLINVGINRTKNREEKTAQQYKRTVNAALKKRKTDEKKVITMLKTPGFSNLPKGSQIRILRLAGLRYRFT